MDVKSHVILDDHIDRQLCVLQCDVHGTLARKERVEVLAVHGSACEQTPSPFGSRFPYACPEPVLANDRFS